jgi:hypothetical protein
LDIRAVRTQNATERIAHLTKIGDCARRSFTLRILGSAAEDLDMGYSAFKNMQNEVNEGMQLEASNE